MTQKSKAAFAWPAMEEAPTVNKLAASKTNTVLDDICRVIGLRATMLLSAWWGGKNIVVPSLRAERSVLSKIIGETAVARLSREYGGEQIFVPRMSWFEEIRKARQACNLQSMGMTVKEIARLMVLTPREVEALIQASRFAASAEDEPAAGCAAGGGPE